MRKGGSSAATMEDVARLAQVSKATVSRALQDNPLVNAETKARILGIARAQGYTVNRNARKLWTKRANTVSVVLHLPDTVERAASWPFLVQLLADVSKGLWIRNQDVLLSSPESDDVSAYRAMLASKGADGFIFLGQGAGDRWLLELARTEVPFVVWGAADDQGRYCTVGSDNRKGGRLVGQRFAELHRRRVLFVGDRSHPEIGQRREGLEQGLRSAGSTAGLADIDLPDFTFESGYSLGKQLGVQGTDRADAIFAASDSTAMGVIVALREMDVRIPEDVTVVGYNDIPAAAHFMAPLTTVRQDTHQAGSLLVEKLFQILDGAKPKSTVLPTELVVRRT